MALIKREVEYKEEVVNGEVLAKEIEQPKKIPIHFSHMGFICGACNQFVVDEPPRNQTVRLYCANVNCSENLIEKIITLPSITDYVVSSVS